MHATSHRRSLKHSKSLVDLLTRHRIAFILDKSTFIHGLRDTEHYNNLQN